MTLEHIEHAEERLRSYWYEDGFAELATGAVFAILGLYFGLQGYFGEGSAITAILQISMIGLFIAEFCFVRRTIQSLKTRWTYPRTGYVEYHADVRNVRLRRYATVAVGLMAGMFLVILHRYIQGVEMVVLATGVLVAFILAALRLKVRGMNRFYLFAACSLAFGIVLSLSALPQAYGLAVFYALMGILIMISGGLVLRRYLLNNPLPPEAPRER